jgi:hypothetical protein
LIFFAKNQMRRSNLSLSTLEYSPSSKQHDLEHDLEHRVLDNHKYVLDTVGNRLGITNISDWYNIRYSNIKSKDLSPIIKEFGSHIKALECIYPHHNWIVGKFKYLSPKYWEKMENQRNYMDWLGVQLGITHLSQWYHISPRYIAKYGGDRLIKKIYKNSLASALESIYSEEKWHFSKSFRKDLPQRAKKSISNQREIFDRLGNQLGIKEMTDWGYVTNADIRSLGGVSILKHYYHGSLSRALENVYPDHKWVHHLPKRKSKGHWMSMVNRKSYFLRLGEKFGFKDLSDWYKISRDDIDSNGGAGLLEYYCNSPMRALQDVYPKYNWLPWKFNKWKTGFIGEKELSSFVGYLTKELKIKDMQDWYRISLNQINKITPNTVVCKLGGISNMLTKVYPQHPWNFHKFSGIFPIKASQRMLRLCVEEIFPNSGN